MWWAVFQHLTPSHDSYPIRAHNCIDSVSNCENCAVVESCVKDLLDQPVGFKIDICSGLIDTENLKRATIVLKIKYSNHLNTEHLNTGQCGCPVFKW